MTKPFTKVRSKKKRKRSQAANHAPSSNLGWFKLGACRMMVSAWSLGWSYPTVVDHFGTLGIDPPPSRRAFFSVVARHRTGKNLQGRARRPSVIDKRTIKLVRRLLTEDPRRYGRELVDILNNRYFISISEETVYTIIHDEMKWSHKKIEYRAQQRQATARLDMLRAYHGDGYDASLAIFIDESHITPDTYRRHGWGPLGEAVTLAAQLSGDQRYSYMGAFNMHGMVPGACQLLRVGDDHGNVDAERFKSWVQRCLLPVLGNYDRREPNSILVLDNCSFHTDDEVLKLIRDRGTHVVFLSAYSPDFNPIELAFGLMKRRFERDTLLHVGMSVHERVDVAADSISATTARRFIRKSYGGKGLEAWEAEDGATIEGDGEDTEQIALGATVAAMITVYAATS